ncbi:MAG: CBS domain-containing protein [Chromatiales bacterium]|nr:CBS domain-containing protein [Chromatiales bacterium]
MHCKIDKLIRESVISMDKKETVLSAVEAMAERNTGSLVVTDDEQVYGLFTERDLLRRVVSRNVDPATTMLEAVCTRQLVSISHDSSCQEAIHRMRSNRCRRLIVYRGEDLLGLVTMNDAAHSLAEQDGRKSMLVNMIGGATLMVVISVIILLIYQLPDMLQLAQQVRAR